MKNRFLILLILTLSVVTSASADEYFNDYSDYTGEVFFTPPSLIEKQKEEQDENASSKERTMPPLKKLRLTVQDKVNEAQEKKTQLAPTNPDDSIYNSDTETSDYVSKEIEENFDEDMMPDGFEADAESIEEHKKTKHFRSKRKENNENNVAEETESIVLDCDNMDYDTDNYCLYATGNVSVDFVKQQTTVKADKITYDRMNNTIKAEGNVKILKHGQTISGDYIFVDMNEENALIEKPETKTAVIEMRAKKGYVYGDKIVQESGTINVDKPFPIYIKPTGAGPQLRQMIIPKEQTLESDMEKGIVKVFAKEIKVTQKGDLETIAIKQTKVKRGKTTIIKIPALKVYTNKNNDYFETNSWELGSYRDLGMYIGPGFVFELPKGSVFKAIPMVNYSSRIGVGALGRFSSGTNKTQLAYGTAKSRILIRGKQKLDDHLYLQYGMNDYMNEWWLGKRRPKYGAALVYERSYGSKDFLLKNLGSQYTHRVDFGYYHDIDKDKHYGELHSSNLGTLRARYMAQASQQLYNYRNEEKQTALSFDIASELSAAVYGTGDTQIIGRVGPRMHLQWKRWMQDLGYYQSTYQDHTPLPVYDAYRYGKSNFYLREYFRLSKYMTIAWFGSINLSGDSYNDYLLQENSFYLSLGPDDIKFNIGYDIVRGNTFFTVEVMTNAQGTQVNYDKLVIKQDKKTQKDKNPGKRTTSDFKNTEKAPVLRHAVVEDIKMVDDVL